MKRKARTSHSTGSSTAKGKAHTHHAGCHGHAASSTTLDAVLERLKHAGLKVTRPRQALLQSILEQSAPFSAEDLFKTAGHGPKSPKLDLVTVYRSLATFAEIELLLRVDLDDGVVRYELAALDGSHHHHITCTTCRRVEPLTVCEIQGQEKILTQMGYSQLSHRLEFFGICPKCSSVKNTPPSRRGL